MPDEKKPLELTGDDTVDLQNEINALLGTQDGNDAVKEPGPIELEVAGSKVKFDSPKQLGEKLTEVLQNYNALRGQVAELQARPQPAAQPSSTNERKGFSNEEFSKYLNEGESGVAKALNYAMNHMFFDGSQPDAAKTVSALLQQSAANNADLTVLRFKDAHPELPRTPETGQILEQVRSRYNLQFTTEGLEAAYAIARQNNLLKVEQAQTQTQQPNNPQQQAMSNNFASPVLSRQPGGNPIQLTESQLEKAWDMPLEELNRLRQKYRNTVI